MLNPHFVGSRHVVTTLLRERISWDRERLNPQLFVPGYLLALWPLTLVSVVQKNMICGSTKIHLKRNIYPHIKKFHGYRSAIPTIHSPTWRAFLWKIPPMLSSPFHFGSSTSGPDPSHHRHLFLVAPMKALALAVRWESSHAAHCRGLRSRSLEVKR